jgi:soluble lytic murein transglycosylase-like protein
MVQVYDKAILRSLASVFLVITLGSTVVGCAGPTNPWGHYGTRLPSNKNDLPVNMRTISSLPDDDSDEANILFYPRRQNLHETSEFSVIIEDLNTVPDNALLSLYYNGNDVTDSWLKKAKISYNQNNTVMTLAFHGVKLLAQKDHDVVVRYQRSPLSKAITQSYLTPTCSLAALEPLGNLGEYTPKQKSYRHLIEGISTQEGVNPSLVAGLIAQESAFNPMAVSHAKAIGLTQVTKGAAHHVLETYNNFPTYPELHTYPVPLIKTMILSGEVNANNEWRLNPRYSIRGGIYYLKLVEDYWLTQENHKVLLKNYKDEEDILDDLILASYNSGPYRVKKALMKKGRKWLESDQLNEARKYVRKVKSYCYHFAANNAPRPQL